jgi:hypothetical protein
MLGKDGQNGLVELKKFSRRKDGNSGSLLCFFIPTCRYYSLLFNHNMGEPSFSKTSSSERALVIGLGGLNLFGVIVLGTMLKYALHTTH